MWNGTAETLNARPTNINTIANTAPVLSLVNCSAIKSKLVEPVKPYSNEQPYNNKPEESALKTKYLIPDSVDLDYLYLLMPEYIMKGIVVLDPYKIILDRWHLPWKTFPKLIIKL